jgi:hypothetical protein
MVPALAHASSGAAPAASSMAGIDQDPAELRCPGAMPWRGFNSAPPADRSGRAPQRQDRLDRRAAPPGRWARPGKSARQARPELQASAASTPTLAARAGGTGAGGVVLDAGARRMPPPEHWSLPGRCRGRTRGRRRAGRGRLGHGAGKCIRRHPRGGGAGGVRRSATCMPARGHLALPPVADRHAALDHRSSSPDAAALAAARRQTVSLASYSVPRMPMSRSACSSGNRRDCVCRSRCSPCAARPARAS